eukprot:s851_g5.t1
MVIFLFYMRRCFTEPKDPKDERLPALGGEPRPEATLNVNSRSVAQRAEQSVQTSQRQGALFGASSDGTSILRKVEQEEDFSSRSRKCLEDACESSPDPSITSISHEFGAQNSQIMQFLNVFEGKQGNGRREDPKRHRQAGERAEDPSFTVSHVMDRLSPCKTFPIR